MSVAFRRESDEEHKETSTTFASINARGLALIDAKVVEVGAAVAAETEAEAKEVLKRELRYWHTRQTTARIAPPPEEDVVGIGSRVRIRLAGKERVIDVVGHDEADPAADRIAFSAPLAHALLGAEAGERIDFNGHAEAIEIVETGPIP